MKLRFSCFENLITINNEEIYSIEIENKGCFYRCVNNLNCIGNGDIINDIYCFDKENNEIVLTNKVTIISDYFNINLTIKKYSNYLSKLISNDYDEIENNSLSNNYKRLKNSFKKILSKIDLPLEINEDFNIDILIKLLKPNIKVTDNLLNNLFLLLDLERIFNLNKLLIFINLKQYLSKLELEELYKYAIYNRVSILLLDSQNYGSTLENEKKLIVDDNLDEIVI